MAKKVAAEQDTSSPAVNDAWTGMLIVSFLALGVGTGFLVWDWYQYNDAELPTPAKIKYANSPPLQQAKKDGAPNPAPVPVPKKDDQAPKAKD